MDKKLRIGIIECGHWHCGGYISGLRESGEDIVAVSDRNPVAAQKKADDLGCRRYSDYHELIEAEKPDFVFAFGRHIEMPAIANALIDSKIPFCIEKPAGINPDDVYRVAVKAQAKGVYAVVPFVCRSANWVSEIIKMKNNGDLGELAHLYFRYIAGPVKRYVNCGCEWMLDKKQAGGGCTINLGVHYIDLFNYITREPVKRVMAAMNNKVSQANIEEMSTVVLTSQTGVIGVVETGYGVPGNGADSYFSIMTKNHFMTVHDDKFLINSQNGQVREMPAGKVSYSIFVKEAINAYKLGQAPIAGLMDAYEALKLIDCAYHEVL